MKIIDQNNPENISKYEEKYVEQTLLKCTKITMDKIARRICNPKKK